MLSVFTHGEEGRHELEVGLVHGLVGGAQSDVPTLAERVAAVRRGIGEYAFDGFLVEDSISVFLSYD